MKKTDLLVLYIYQLSQALRKGKHSTISERDIFSLLGIREEASHDLSDQALRLVVGEFSAEAHLLFSLSISQQAMRNQSIPLAKKATYMLLRSVNELPSLQSPALVEILQKLNGIQKSQISA